LDSGPVLPTGPLVFVGYRIDYGGESDLLSQKLKLDLGARGVTLQRGADRSPAGEMIEAHVFPDIERSDGLMLLWSAPARTSAWVNAEYTYARSIGRRICLLQFPGVDPPDEWPPGLKRVKLRGVSYSSLTVDGKTRLSTTEPSYGELLAELAEFAYRAMSFKRGVELPPWLST
jgi:hypothetical protein